MASPDQPRQTTGRKGRIAKPIAGGRLPCAQRQGRTIACRIGPHALRQTKTAQISGKTGNLRAGPLLPGHPKLESTVRDPGIERDDALAISGQVKL
ncbi:MAG: hypothetical protein ACREFA_15930 [Stellaceae bacterium]